MVEGSTVMVEEYARQMVQAEELHAGDVDKMLRQPGEVDVLRPTRQNPSDHEPIGPAEGGRTQHGATRRERRHRGDLHRPGELPVILFAASLLDLCNCHLRGSINHAPSALCLSAALAWRLRALRTVGATLRCLLPWIVGADGRSAEEVLVGAADWAKKHPDMPVIVASYADPYGSQKANADFTRLRTQAVVDGLVANGVLASRIAAPGNRLSQLPDQRSGKPPGRNHRRTPLTIGGRLSHHRPPVSALAMLVSRMVVSAACVISFGVASAAPAPSFTAPFGCGTVIGFTSTGAIPCFLRSSWSATNGLTSITLPRAYGPRSWTLTVALLPFRRFVTFAVVPNGKLLLAATFDCGFIGRPSAIFRWANWRP